MTKSFRLLLSGILLTTLSFEAPAQTAPAPQHLLPADIFGIATVPDMNRLREFNEDSPWAYLWNDSSMRAFRENFMDQFNEAVLQPLEQEMGIQLTNYLSLVQGQLTIAITRNNFTGGPGQVPGLAVLLDSGDQSERLRTLLSDLEKKWIDAGEQTRRETIRSVPFSVLILPKSVVEDAIPLDEEDVVPAEPAEEDPLLEEEEKPVEIFIGQAGSLLIAGTAKTDIEKIVALRQGGSVLALAESTEFLQNYNQLFRDSLSYGWLHVAPFMEIARKMAVEASEASAGSGQNPMMPQPDRILRGLGLLGMKTVAFASHDRGNGASSDLFVGVPAAERRGLFRLLEFESKDSSPPAFVPENVVTFSRTRLDLTKMWNSLEAMVAEVMPPMAGMLRMTIDSAGKQQDPTFDLRRDVINNLGDDVIYWQKPPEGSSLMEISSPPTIYLISAKDADQLYKSIRVLLAPMMEQLGESGEREFLGRQVLTFNLPPITLPGNEEPTPRSISLASSGSYLVISTDGTLLEEFLRASDGISNPLRNRIGLGLAADSVGGFNTGLFAYTNDQLYTRMFYNFLKSDQGEGGGGLQQLLNLFGASDALDDVRQWFNPDLLPAFESIEKYFHFTVQTAAVTREGYRVKIYVPNPPNYRN